MAAAAAHAVVVRGPVRCLAIATGAPAPHFPSRANADPVGVAGPQPGQPKHVPSASWKVSARPENVSHVRHSVVEFARKNRVPRSVLADVALAVSEAVTNVAVHAFRDQLEPGTMLLSMDVAQEGGQIEVTVTDAGSGMVTREDSPGLGLGLPLIGRLAHEVGYTRPSGGGTALWMSFRFPTREPEPLEPGKRANVRG
jgi:serine/threonine-protein kinase RsbW